MLPRKRKRLSQRNNTIDHHNTKSRAGSTLEPKKEYKDYLRQQRLQREEDSSSNSQYINPTIDWRSVNQTKRYDDRTKVDLIKLKSHQIDEILKMKEKSFNYSNAPIEDTYEINNMLVNSIEAKLTVLNKLNQA